MELMTEIKVSYICEKTGRITGKSSVISVFQLMKVKPENGCKVPHN